MGIIKLRVILSRKGFDIVNGGMASPIFPNNQIISLPIPSHNDNIRYSELKLNNSETYYSFISNLQRNKRKKMILISDTCHLDPDIYPKILKRNKEWKPLFGQVGASQTHLEDNNIGIGDLFLFFGWFRHTQLINNELRFDKRKNYSLHVVFGYFQIDQVLTNQSEFKFWMKYHPHIANKTRFQKENNCIYVAKEKLTWNSDLPGAAPFMEFNENLVLTKRDKNGTYMSRSKWFFNAKHPFGKKIDITYHSKKSWQNNYFQSASIGQEFILENCKEVETWAKKLIDENYSRINISID